MRCGYRTTVLQRHLRMKILRCYKRCLASISQRPAWCFAIPKDCQAVCDALNAVGQKRVGAPRRDLEQRTTRAFGRFAMAVCHRHVAARGWSDEVNSELVVNYELARDGCVICVLAVRRAREVAVWRSVSAEGATGKYSFRNAATQTELAECARRSLLPSGRRDGCLCIDGGKSEMRPGIF